MAAATLLAPTEEYSPKFVKLVTSVVDRWRNRKHLTEAPTVFSLVVVPKQSHETSAVDESQFQDTGCKQELLTLLPLDIEQAVYEPPIRTSSSKSIPEGPLLKRKDTIASLFDLWRTQSSMNDLHSSIGTNVEEDSIVDDSIAPVEFSSDPCTTLISQDLTSEQFSFSGSVSGPDEAQLDPNIATSSPGLVDTVIARWHSFKPNRQLSPEPQHSMQTIGQFHSTLEETPFTNVSQLAYSTDAFTKYPLAPHAIHLTASFADEEKAPVETPDHHTGLLAHLPRTKSAKEIPIYDPDPTDNDAIIWGRPADRGAIARLHHSTDVIPMLVQVMSWHPNLIGMVALIASLCILAVGISTPQSEIPELTPVVSITPGEMAAEMAVEMTNEDHTDIKGLPLEDLRNYAITRLRSAYQYVMGHPKTALAVPAILMATRRPSLARNGAVQPLRMTTQLPLAPRDIAPTFKVNPELPSFGANVGFKLAGTVQQTIGKTLVPDHGGLPYHGLTHQP